MKISAKLTAVIFAAIAAFASVSCEKSESNIKPEEILGSFTCDDNTYNIRSVVVYPLDNGQTEIWISETAGYTTVEQIEASVGELVLIAENSLIGNGKHTYGPEEKIKFIKYDGKTNSGFATLKCIFDEDNNTIDLEFSSAELKSSLNAISGSYKGPYSNYSVPALNNQWAYNRQAKDIVSADYFEMEDDAPSKLVIFDNEGEAIELVIPEEHVNTELTIRSSDTNKPTIKYDNGDIFEIYAGKIKIEVPEKTNNAKKTLNVHLKLTNSAGKTLRADYQGAYRHRFGNKTNRCIYDSGFDGGNGYDGKFSLNSMTVSESADKITFRFTPGDHLGSGQIDQTAPTFTVSKSLVNAGEANTEDISDIWNFKYNMFELYSYDSTASEDRPTAVPGSVINVEKDSDGTYTVNIEVSYLFDKTVTQEKRDENGNIIYIDKPIKNELTGEYIYKEDGTPETEKVPDTETVTIKAPTSIDLYFKGQATND